MDLNMKEMSPTICSWRPTQTRGDLSGSLIIPIIRFLSVRLRFLFLFLYVCLCVFFDAFVCACMCGMRPVPPSWSCCNVNLSFLSLHPLPLSSVAA